jgi:hypothetical protein
MWAIGIGLLLAATAAAIAYLNRGRTRPLLGGQWDLATLSTSYSGIIAPIAAFTVASAVFLANLTRATESHAFEQVIALFLIAFIVLIGTALMFATFRGVLATGESSEDFIVSRRVMYVLANLGFYLGLNLGWLGLQPLLKALELDDLGPVFSWVLFFSILSGSMRQGAWCHSLLGASNLASYAMTAVALVAALVYRLVLVPLFGGLWPGNPTLTFAIVVFAFGAVIFSVETTMIRLNGSQEAERRLARLGSLLVPPYAACAATCLLLLWLALFVG